MTMNTFTKEQLNLINTIKKTFNIQVVWHYLEYLRIEQELGHTPSIAELVANGGETESGTWAMSIGGLKEMGLIQKKTRIQTVEDLLWKSNFQEILWDCVKPYTNEDGFVSVDHKMRAQSAVHTLCDTQAKATPDKADTIRECEEKCLENIEQLWDSQFSSVQ